jgi:hypothetical protein
MRVRFFRGRDNFVVGNFSDGSESYVFFDRYREQGGLLRDEADLAPEP